jgi:serine/threonine-protein kinase
VVRFGRYELIGELASGGMGVVYLARLAGEAGFQRLFAVKVMHEHLAKEREFVEMLLDEARVASRLHHANVVPIVDLGVQDERHFLVMDYVEGCSLAQLCRRHRRERPSRLMVPILLDVLEGLHSAHTLVDDEDQPLHLVHRDMSAQNVMVGVDGSARVIDFGIAKAEARISSTRPGVLKGKLAYMAPEQLMDSSATDARSDVFSVGVMLWTTLTGTRLFQADTESATLANVLQKEVPLPSTVGFAPPACYDAICLRALERDPAKRYATAAEMASALRKAAIEHDSLGSRSEIAAFVKNTFRNEFAARRDAIRAHSAAPTTPLSLGDIEDLASIPALTDTPSSVESTPSSNVRLAEEAASRGGTILSAGSASAPDAPDPSRAPNRSVAPTASASSDPGTDPSVRVELEVDANRRRRRTIVVAVGALAAVAIGTAVAITAIGSGSPEASADRMAAGVATVDPAESGPKESPAEASPVVAATSTSQASSGASDATAATAAPASTSASGSKRRAASAPASTSATKNPPATSGKPASTAPSMEVNPYVH